MTNSTPPTNKPKDQCQREKTRQKKHGIFRTEAIIPVSIIFILIFTYIILFFDHHLRRGLEWMGSQINGAELISAIFKPTL